MVDEARTSLENNNMTAIMAIDLSSAYDLVDHAILVEKCRLMNLGQIALKWIKDFLRRRSQYVEIGGIKTKELLSGDEGVVQGGPSSGELFVIFLNNLPIKIPPKELIDKKPNTQSNMFVDDHNSVIGGKNMDDLTKNIKQEFDRIYDFLIQHKMKINSSKTQLMILNPNEQQKNTPTLIHKSLISHQDHIRVLGITLSENLKFDNHLISGKCNMTKKLNSKINMLRVVKPFISQKALGMVANNLINSPIWCPHLEHNQPIKH